MTRTTKCLHTSSASIYLHTSCCATVQRQSSNKSGTNRKLQPKTQTLPQTTKLMPKCTMGPLPHETTYFQQCLPIGLVRYRSAIEHAPGRVFTGPAESSSEKVEPLNTLNDTSAKGLLKATRCTHGNNLGTAINGSETNTMLCYMMRSGRPSEVCKLTSLCAHTRVPEQCR
jgi:hypothetical protein